MSYAEQELLTLLEYLSSPTDFSIWVNNLLLMFGLGLFSLFFFYKFLIFRKAAFREMEISVANTVLDKKGPKRRNFKIGF
jgi:hypothetical protein